MTIRAYFEQLDKWPPTPIQIDEGVYVANPEKMVKRHIAYISHYGTEGIGAPYYQRLNQLRKAIEHESYPSNTGLDRSDSAD